MNDPLLDLIQGKPAPANNPPISSQGNGSVDPLLSLVNPQWQAQPVQQAVPSGMPVSAPDKLGTVANFMGSMIHHFNNPIHGLAQQVEHGVQSLANMTGQNPVTNYINNVVNQDDQAMTQRENQYQAKVPDNAASFAGATAGELLPFAASGVANSLKYVGDTAANAVNKIAPNIPKIIPQMVGGAAQGDLIAQAQPVTGTGDYWTQKHEQEKYGTAGGALGPFGIGTIASMISPNPSAAYTNLSNAGVTTTMGQRLGGILNTMEDKAQSLPIVGDMISKSRANALQSWNKATLNQVVAPIGGNVNTVGHEGVAEAGDLISAAYDKGKSALGGFKIDQQGAQGLTALQNGVSNATNLTAQGKAVFNNLLSLVKQQVSPNGSMLPQGFKELDSKLTQEAVRYSGASDAYQQNLGDAIKQLQSVITDNAKRANPQAAALLDSADEAWAKLVRVEGAAKSAASNKVNTGIFTPSQLMQAVRSSDQSVRDRATARGQALMQDWAQNGMQVLGDKVPNSGSFDRAANGALIAALYAHPAAAVPTLTGIGAGSMLYTPAGQKLAVGALTNRPQSATAIADFLRKYIPSVAP